MKLSHVLALCCSLFLSTFAASYAQAANPMAVAFRTTTNVTKYAKPTGMIITGRCNVYHSTMATVRANGGEVLAYLNPASRPDGWVCALDEKFYMGNYGSVPLWPYPSYGQRSVFANSHMADVRKGGKWSNYVVSYVEKLMRERKVDGIFLDVVGCRPWGLSNWTSWPQWEKDMWTDAMVDLVRRIDLKRRAINPDFIVVNNNVWECKAKYTRGLPGEKYVDGVMLEHPPGVNLYHKNYMQRPFSNLGHRRTLVIARNNDEARQWAAVPSVTHVSNQTNAQYSYPTVPIIGFKPLYDR